MKIIKKNVFYCDFCKKKNLSKSAMTKHEKHCTANPDRECRMCGGVNIKNVIADFKKRFRVYEQTQYHNITGAMMGQETKLEWLGEQITLDEVRNSVDNCPACILTVLRQCGFFNDCFGDGIANEFMDKFYFKQEMTDAMADKNRERNENEDRYMHERYDFT